MRSIRLSLIVYFLVLLALAMGAVSFLVYRTTAQAMQEKQAINRELLKTQFKNEQQEERRKLENELYSHARTIATLAQSQFEGNRLFVLQFAVLGSITSTASPYGHATTPLWVAEPRSPIRWELYPLVAAEIRLNEELLHREEDRGTDFFQINSFKGRAWRSKSLGDRVFPFDAEHARKMDLYIPEFDDFTLDGIQLRRVKFRAPIFKFGSTPAVHRFPFTPEAGRGGNRGAGSQPPPPPRTADPRPQPPQLANTIVIQCASDVGPRDRALAKLDENLAEELKQLDAESHETLVQLRQQLLLISMVTFVATIIGGFLLVSFGLAPLHRLSDAVSRVSENHLRLDYDGPPPPVELRPIIDRLTQALTLLQQAFDREKQSTADISHELRTPLAGLLTTIEVTLRKARTPEEYRETLAECRGLAKLMTQLVERLLTLTRIDSRSDRLRVETVDATELTEQCASLIRPLARANGLNLNVHRNGAVQIRTDPDKLREVIANLMHNAVEYNHPAGSVDVSVKSADGTLDLEVTDTGIGIAPEHRQRIFERFFRADPSRQATGLHAGLGLAIVRGYVELMGGTISVESEMGRGSTFRVRIPSTDPAHRT